MKNDAQQAGDDSALVTRLSAGDVAALRTIMADHWEHLMAVATIITGSSDVACEAVQDAFVQTWNARETLDARRGIGGYLTMVTVRRARDILRHERVHVRTAQRLATHRLTDGDAATQNSGDSDIESAELRARVYEAIGKLPPRCREIFLLRRETHLSYDEIETLLGISNATIRNQMSKAVQAIARTVTAWRNGN
jgi:RNA polymerase sigma-70 factor, ECF subfamily